jgi:predicted DNA-binding protein (MmcQ/YjbR family)
VTARELQDLCLALPGAIEDFPFGPETSVFRVGGKMFGLSALAGRPLHVSLKCEPELAVELRATYAAIAPGYHLNKRHWITVTLDGSLPDEMLRDLVEDSYALVARRGRCDPSRGRSDALEAQLDLRGSSSGP